MLRFDPRRMDESERRFLEREEAFLRDLDQERARLQGIRNMIDQRFGTPRSQQADLLVPWRRSL